MEREVGADHCLLKPGTVKTLESAHSTAGLDSENGVQQAEGVDLALKDAVLQQATGCAHVPR